MSWYVISAKPHQESVAESTLQRLGVETFCPILRQTRVIQRKIRTTFTPLFPGYLFGKFDVDRQYRAVKYARGVRTLLSFGSELATVEDGMVETIRSRSQGGYVTIEHAQFMPGQAVRIQEGPLCGLQAVFEREMSGSERVILLVKAVSYQAKVEVDLKAVANF